MRLWYCLSTLIIGLVTLLLVYLNIVARITWQDDHGPNSAPTLGPTVGLGVVGIVLVLLSVFGAALWASAKANAQPLVDGPTDPRE
jgi:hypothetical protein